MNTITLCGRLGRDAEEKTLDSGQRLLNLNLATSRKKGGSEETLWWRVTVWGDRFKNMEPYFKKGSALIVVGSFNYPRIYQDQNGTNQASLEVTAHNISFSPFGGAATQENQGTSPSMQMAQPHQEMGQPQQGQAPVVNDSSIALDEKYGFKEDEIPF